MDYFSLPCCCCNKLTEWGKGLPVNVCVLQFCICRMFWHFIIRVSLFFSFVENLLLFFLNTYIFNISVCFPPWSLCFFASTNSCCFSYSSILHSPIVWMLVFAHVRKCNLMGKGQTEQRSSFKSRCPSDVSVVGAEMLRRILLLFWEIEQAFDVFIEFFFVFFQYSL